jgi:asparagine synthase (glutamine-hydrolysing)
MALDFRLLLPTTLLTKMDIASMANSLEGRSPFLSRDLIEWAPLIPDKWKVHGRTTKYILRRIARKYLPAPLSSQPKRGFEVPLREWIDTRLRGIVNDLVGSPSAYVRSLVRPRFVDDLIAGRTGILPEQRARILFAMLSIECWKRNSGQ